MVILKCKMCGGALEISGNESVVTCAYCGTQQTLPKLNDDRKINLYDRANHFRRNNEFDKAMGIYEQILNEDNTDAESYWSLVLCRYGIEYVEDPMTHKRVPTVNRAQFTSVFDDDNYKAALQYADAVQRGIYEEEAKAINEIQKGILAISQKEEPFDVFICYKETDQNGRRTPDSVLANDLYHQLTQEGFKVFFSRITLEDKLGSAYEPYIFAALNSAKVMVVLGTRPEYFKAVWVRNEWSRYLGLIKQGQSKMLIPAYKDMDPYDLPEEFSHLQAQDMSKLGFMQDLIRGIKKIAQADEPQVAVVKETVVTGGNANIETLLKRVFMFLEDRDWKSADEYCEKVLDIDPENAEAYLGKLMADLEVNNQEDLKHEKQPFDNNLYYKKVVRFGSVDIQKTVKGYVDFINERNENERLEGIYTRGKNLMNSEHSESSYREAANVFKTIPGYKDTDSLVEKCLESAEAARKDKILSDAKSKMTGTEIKNYEEAVNKLKAISGWKNADDLIAEAKKKIKKLEEERLEHERQAEIARKEAERKAEEERKERERLAAERAKRNKKIAMIVTPIVCIVIGVIIFVNTVVVPKNKYNDAMALMEAGKYQEALEVFKELGEYQDSAEKITECQYGEAVALLEAEKYKEAFFVFEELRDYKDSKEQALLIYEEHKEEINFEKIKSANVGDYVVFGSYEQDNDTSNGAEEVEWLVLEVKDGKALLLSKNGLDCQKYNEKFEAVTWETCTLRKWLNDTFLNTAFTKAERGMIPTVTVSADDQVFLLSIPEAEKYFSSDAERVCEATAYAKGKGAHVVDKGASWWWLRSPGNYDTRAANVNYGGSVNADGSNVRYDNLVVRPALWVDLNSDIF